MHLRRHLYGGMSPALMGAASPPAIVSTTGYANDVSGASWTMLSGVTVAAGELLLAFVDSSSFGVALTTASAGWSKYGEASPPGDASVRLAVFSKIATGTSETLVISNWSSGRPQGILVRIANATNFSGTLAGGTTDTQPNPPSHNAGASRSHIWLAVGAAGLTTPSSGFTTAPSGYSGLVSVAANSSGIILAAANKTLTAQTEDPGAFATRLPRQ